MDSRIVIQPGPLDFAFKFVGVVVAPPRRARCPSTLLSMAITAFLLSGCGGDPNVATVSGVVTLDGEPLERVSVLFQPEKGRPSFGVTDDQGRYKLTYSRSQNGATVGTCIVKLTKLSDAGDEEEPGKKAPPPSVKIPDRYVKEPITVTVQRAHNTIDLELTTDP